jgi:signal transduction histidine kinase
VAFGSISECGLVSISNEELERWWHDPHARLKFSLLDALDGAQPAASGYFPHSSVAPNGQVWFANSSVLQMVDPAERVTVPPPPPVRIEKIMADRQEYSPSLGAHIPALTPDLEIDYTAPTFFVPQRVKFRYRLEGHDPNWIEAGTRRQAFYTDLRPGQYRFRVTASNAAGQWNAQDAGIDVFLPPMYYQTKWFFALCAAFGLIALWSLFRLRLTQIKTRLRSRLEVRMAERERIARDLHDTFFQGIQGLLLMINTATNRLRDEEPTRAVLKDALKRSDQVMAEGRQLVLDLRAESYADVSLSDALALVGSELKEVYSVAFSVTVVGTPAPLHPIVFEEVYRVAREAIFNAFQHANASLIEIKIAYERTEFRIHVRDNGADVQSSSTSVDFHPAGWKALARAGLIAACFYRWQRVGTALQ